MRYLNTLAVLAASVALAGCADPVAPTADSFASAPSQPVMFAAGGTETIPVVFVTQFASFNSGETREHGMSGRVRSRFCLSFTVQEGDLEGTMDTCFSANDPSDQTVSHGKNGWFTTTSPEFTHYDVCMPSRGLCGTFDEATSAGKVYPQPRGVQFNNSVAFGGGGFEGMKLQGSVAECLDSNGDRGCFTGTLQVPGHQ